jgi:hypothetical protein
LPSTSPFVEEDFSNDDEIEDETKSDLALAERGR